MKAGLGCCIESTRTASIVRSFWLLGLLNNALWVLMLACATNISSGGVALVFLSNQIPGLLVKLTAPYWFHLISYKTRILMASFAMGMACFLVGCGGLLSGEMADDDNQEPQYERDRKSGLALELLGVSFESFSCSLGEASLLALAGRFDSIILPSISSSTDPYWVLSENNQTEEDDVDNTQQICRERAFSEEYQTESEDNAVRLMKQENITKSSACITSFSSGTGLAGIVGYGYKALFSDLFGLGLSATVWSAMLFAVAYSSIYLMGLHSIQQQTEQSETGASTASESSLLVRIDNEKSERSIGDQSPNNFNRRNSSSALEMVHTEELHHNNATHQLEEAIAQTESSTVLTHNLTSVERFKVVLSLWPYTIPLFTVYAAEYMLQAGVWSSIGFPVTSPSARAKFYHYSNWTYQAGVFLSRSSGNLWSATMLILWAMPLFQVANLYFFWLNSIHHFWYNYYLLLPCFFAGLLGGAVYVQGFSRVNRDMPIELKEFAIASVGVADSLGILVADITSLYIQSCIFKKNDLQGAIVDCPL